MAAAIPSGILTLISQQPPQGKLFFKKKLIKTMVWIGSEFC